MENLPKNWININFTDLLDINGGTQPPKSQFIYEPKYGYIRLLQIRDFGNKPVPTYVPDTGKLRTCSKDDVLIARYGASVGRIVSGQEGAYNVALAKVNIPEDINKNFIKWLLKSHLFQNVITSFQRTAQSGFNKDDLSRIIIPLPPLPEQKRIEAKLDVLFGHLEHLKDRLEQIPTLLKEFKQSVLTQAVTGKLTQEWREGKKLDEEFFNKIEKSHLNKKKPVKVRGKKGFNEEIKLYDIPTTWRWISNYKLTVDGGNAICAGPFGTIFKAKDFRNEGVPIIFLRHVKPEGFNQRKPNYMDPVVWEEYHKEYSIYGGELLITKLGDPPGDATIFPSDFGVAMVTPDVMKANYNNEIFKTIYASYFFNSSVCKDIISEVSFGMTRLRIDLTMFKSFPLPVPTIDEQTEIVKRVEALFTKADLIEAAYHKLKLQIDSLPQAILTKAFKGELVEQLPTDGNAADLLEEIKKLKAVMGKKGKKTR